VLFLGLSELIKPIIFYAQSASPCYGFTLYVNFTAFRYRSYWVPVQFLFCEVSSALWNLVHFWFLVICLSTESTWHIYQRYTFLITFFNLFWSCQNLCKCTVICRRSVSFFMSVFMSFFSIFHKHNLYWVCKAVNVVMFLGVNAKIMFNVCICDDYTQCLKKAPPYCDDNFVKS